MRKSSRQMDATFALEVLDKAPYVTVSFIRPDGTPYGLPLSLARTDERTFYFHCALEGEKLDCIAHCPTVFLSAVTKCAPTVGPKDGNFTLQYKSATAVGKAEMVTDREEKSANGSSPSTWTLSMLPLSAASNGRPWCASPSRSLPSASASSTTNKGRK